MDWQVRTVPSFNVEERPRANKSGTQMTGIPLPRRRITPSRSTAVEGYDVPDYSVDAVGVTEPHSSEVSRKSFRVLLAISTALHIRMRTIPTSPATQSLPRMLCIEASVEEMEPVDFQVEAIHVETGGKMNIRSLSTLGQASDFPFDVTRSQIHEMVYTMQMQSQFVGSVTRAGAKDSFEWHGPQPISIRVKGRPYQWQDKHESSARVYLAPSFESRWNCMLDASDSPAMRTALAENRIRSAKVDRGSVLSSASMDRWSQSELDEGPFMIHSEYSSALQSQPKPRNLPRSSYRYCCYRITKQISKNPNGMQAVCPPSNHSYRFGLRLQSSTHPVSLRVW